ncbi:MAG TPA: hypothetical protein VIF15_06475 [Polyangiaceae bacterium]|jgi:hypothetical protein
MELHADARIPFARDVVFAAYRDDITKVLAYLPNVRSIDCTKRTEDGPIISLVNIWHGGGEIPAAARAVLSESMLSWTDYATWDAAKLICDWRIETHAVTEAVECKGRNTFYEDGPGKTLVEIRGRIEIDAKKIRGVPGFLAGKVGRTVEEFLGNKIAPNLIETARGITQYLEARGKAG